MVKHTQTIRRQQPTNCLSVFGHFVGLALKGLINLQPHLLKINSEIGDEPLHSMLILAHSQQIKQ